MAAERESLRDLRRIRPRSSLLWRSGFQEQTERAQKTLREAGQKAGKADRVLSGDILVEQNIHLIDVNNWVLQALPLSAQGTGGRTGRRDTGDCLDVTYTYSKDIHITLTSTQFLEGPWDVAMRYFGTESNAEMHYDAPVRVTGKGKWEFPIGSTAGVTASSASVAGAFSGARNPRLRQCSAARPRTADSR